MVNKDQEETTIETIPTEEPVSPAVLFFQHLARYPLSDDEKYDLATSLMTHSVPTDKYRVMLFLSAIICILWLLRPSEPVVIWSMLIAPLLWPLQAFAFSIVHAKKRSLARLLSVLWITMGICVLLSITITRMVWYDQPNSAILARTTPTITDLLIALASGAVAFFALRYKDITASVAGVAIAASLLPPLCVIGIGIALWDWHIANGSAILFITNIASIIAIWVLLCLLFWFSPHQEQDAKRSIWFMSGSLIVLILLCVSLLRQ